MARRVPVVSLLLCLCLLSVASSQRGALVKPRSLDQLTYQADRIVHGHVVSAKVAPHPQYPHLTTVEVKVRVTEMLKGTAPKEFTFRQFIWDIRDKHDMAGYGKGQEVVLFLNKTTAEGFTSTAGLDQGRFQIERTASGQELVRGHAPNQVLLKSVSSVLAKNRKTLSPSLRKAEKDASASMDLQDFKRTVRDLANLRGTR